MTGVITTGKDCWHNCSMVFYDWVSYSSTNCAQNMWSFCPLTVRVCAYTNTRTRPVLSNRVCCDRARRAKSEELSLLDIWACHHSSEASFRVAGQSWPLPRGVLEPMTFEGLGVSTLSTLTDRLKLTWALPQALIRLVLFAAQMNCQNLFSHQLITRPFDCAVLWLST